MNNDEAEEIMKKLGVDKPVDALILQSYQAGFVDGYRLAMLHVHRHENISNIVLRYARMYLKRIKEASEG